ncbi:MAG: APC family permease [Gammaproteobacteria bacterium]|jgi:amino acid transporter|nr:APC family permease [Gammaproteobacteria bacterium]
MAPDRGSPGPPHPALKRDIGLVLFALYGTGNIIGAGIYVLVGEVAGAAGTLAPLAFVIAAIVAGLTGLSYGELAARYPVAAGEAVYVSAAFQRRWLAVAAGLLIAAAGLVSAATMARGFVGYFQLFVPLHEVLIITGLVSALTVLAVRGIAESARFAAVLTLVEAGGLLWIAAVAAPNLPTLAQLPAAALLQPGEPVWSGVFTGVFIAFFAFIGFEDMVSIAEEVKDPARTIPRGIVLAFALASTLYLLVVTVAIATLPPAELAQSEAPLAAVYRAATGQPAVFIGLIGIVAVVNGALIQIIKGARVFYGMSNNGWLPTFLGTVSPRTQTPVTATLVAGGSVWLLALLLPLVRLAELTSACVLIVFILVNLALLRIRRAQPAAAERRGLPLWVPALGAACSAGILIGGLL